MGGAGMREIGFLELRTAEGGVTQVPMRAGMVIGRSVEADLVLDHAGVSRRHAELVVDAGGRWVVRDLGSRNGTLVNGSVVREHWLRHGDHIAIADALLRVNLESLPPPPTREVRSGFQVDATIHSDVADALTVNTLGEMGSPKLDTAHLFALQRFSRRLIETAHPSDRLRLLCELMIGAEMRGRYAATLRVPLSDTAAAPEATCGPLAANARSGRFYLSQTVLRAARERREPVLASNASTSEASLELSIAQSAEAMSVVACPLSMDEEAVELLYVIVPGEYGTGEWLALAALAAEQHGQAEQAWVSRKRAEANAVLERDLARAREVQMGLLPREVSVPGLDVALHFEPCREIGGDYVDVVPMADGRVLLTVADVCGKGMQAALVSATVHAAVRSAVSMGQPMASWMTGLNQFLGERLPAGSFVTMTAAALDPKTGEVEVVNAGHPPAILVDAGGAARAMDIGGNLPLGIDPSALEPQRASLEPGGWLALYTDGLTEIVGNDGKWLGTKGLASYLAGMCRGAEASRVAVRLVAALGEAAAGEEAGDDQTFLLVRRLP